ncbi:MAG: peptidylprolyl isomerase [Thermoplasmata archaeon]|nr:peptidylprolyl isomerase [Thermoplasmata archaeon]
MARRKKAGELRDTEVECGYCNSIIPEDAVKCPNCGKLFSAAKKMVAFAIVVVIVLAGMSYFVYASYFASHNAVDNSLDNDIPDDTDDTPDVVPAGTKFMLISTNYGQIKIQLDTVNAPLTTAHMMSLVNSGWFTGGSWYRAVPNFVLQGGTERSDKGSSTTNVAWEDTGLKNVAYSVAMARSGSASDFASSGTGSSEFFINLVDNTNLDTQYAYVVFGKVVEGTGVISTIMGLPAPDQYLTTPVLFTSVTIIGA